MVVAAYADGGVIGANPSQVGGTWAWCHVNAEGERIACASGVITPATYGVEAVTNNLTELVALLRCLYALPAGWSGGVYSDSQITLGRVFQGWKCGNVPVVLKYRIREATGRLGQIRWALLDGHPTNAQLVAGIGKRGNPVSEHNCWCDAECQRIGRAHLAAMGHE